MNQASATTCPNCNSAIETGDAFCGSCGQRVTWCGSCGAPARAGAAFCSSCGSALTAGEAATASPVAVSAPTPAPATTVGPATTSATPAATVTPAVATPSTPSTGPATTAPETPIPRAPGIASVTALIAGVAAAAAAFLPWLSDPSGFTGDFNALDIPIAALYDANAGDMAVKLGHLVIGLGIGLAALAFIATAGTWRRILGIAIVIAALAYAWQLSSSFEDAGLGRADVLDFYGYGAWMTVAAGGFVAIKP